MAHNPNVMDKSVLRTRIFFGMFLEWHTPPDVMETFVLLTRIPNGPKWPQDALQDEGSRAADYKAWAYQF